MARLGSILVFSQTSHASEKALLKASVFLKGDLKLTVNREKTQGMHRSAGVNYLGVLIHTAHNAIPTKKLFGVQGKDEEGHHPTAAKRR